MRFLRHGDLMTVLATIEDPVYLSEPYIITKSFRLNPDAAPMSPVGPPCIPTYEGTAEGSVPHILPGENPSIDELTTLYHIPRNAVLGGASTMYPEYRKTMKDAFVRPEKCPANCGAPAAPPLQQQQSAPAAPPPGRGAAAAPRPDTPQSIAHLDAAKKLAGTDPWLLSPYNFYCVPGNARGNNATAPELEPVRLFDNVYAVGNSETTVYAITTSQGIILIDSGYTDRVETVVIAGLKKLGLDPANVKYVLLGHGHADHFGGARYFQEHYGTKVGTTAADWAVIYPANLASRPGDRPGPAETRSGPRRRAAGDARRCHRDADRHPRPHARLAGVHLSGERWPANPYRRAVRRHHPHRRSDHDARVEAVRRVDRALSGDGEAAEGRCRASEPPDFRPDARPAGEAEEPESGRTASVHDRHGRYVKFWSVVSECIQAESSRSRGNDE